MNNKEIPEINKMQLNKKKYFDKIINWFTLFDNYAKQITENSALGNFKDVIEAYIHNMQSNHSDLDSGNQSALLFHFYFRLIYKDVIFLKVNLLLLVKIIVML